MVSWHGSEDFPLRGSHWLVASWAWQVRLGHRLHCNCPCRGLKYHRAWPCHTDPSEALHLCGSNKKLNGGECWEIKPQTGTPLALQSSWSYKHALEFLKVLW